MSEWRPIETAPKDGTRVVLGWLDRAWAHPGYYAADHGGWANDEDHAGFFDEPTHWMPMPPPPTPSEVEP